MAAIDLVIVAHQVKHAVKHQDLQFLFQGVAEFASLRASAAQGDGETFRPDRFRSAGVTGAEGNESTSVA